MHPARPRAFRSPRTRPALPRAYLLLVRIMYRSANSSTLPHYPTNTRVFRLNKVARWGARPPNHGGYEFASCRMVYRQYKCADDLRLRATCRVGKRARRPRTRPNNRTRASARLQRAEYRLGSLAQYPHNMTAFPVVQTATWVVSRKHSRHSERSSCLWTLS